MKYFSKNKSGFVSITTFTISIFVTITLLAFSYNFYENSKTQSEQSIFQTEILNSITSFRTQVLSIQNLKNSTLYYNSKLDSKQIKIQITSNQITGSIISNSILHTKSIPSLIQFCEDYTFYPASKTTFNYNGTCISKLN
jgi:hypothetical protein